MKRSDLFCGNSCQLFNDDASNLYSMWPTPTVIISDGPYGIKGFPGDLPSPIGLAAWYEPHIKEWSSKSSPLTTLWFWNTEIGWATVHPILEKYGWTYVACCTWDKGLGHIAGNTNSKTLRHFPIATEVCVQYVKRPAFLVESTTLCMKDWLRHEWSRTGLPFSKTNHACGVKDAATRKYFTKCHLWYMPPADAFDKIVTYANTYGNPSGRPYFSLDGKTPVTKTQWKQMRAKFYCPIGVTNVWHVPQLRDTEREKNNGKAVHLNQKPLSLIGQIIECSSDKGDTVWDPFAGLFTTAIAAIKLERKCFCAEINDAIYDDGISRVKKLLNNC